MAGKRKSKETVPDVDGVAGTSAGITLNLGNFQTARFDCWVTLPCKASAASDTFHKCVDFVNEKLGEEAQKIYAEHEELRGEMSTE